MKINTDEMQDKYNAATPGPWEWEAEDHSLLTLKGPGDSNHVLSAFACESCKQDDHDKEKHCLWPNKADADFIEYAHNIWPLVTNELIDLQNQVDGLKEEIRNISEYQN